MSRLREIWKILVNKVDKISLEEFRNSYGEEALEMAISPNPYFSIKEDYLRVNNWPKRFTNFESGKKDDELVEILIDYLKNGYRSKNIQIVEEIKSNLSIDDTRIYKTLGRKGYLKYNELPFFLTEEPISVNLQEENYERVDLTHLYSFSVDDDETIEVDDAISIDGNKVYIHVADVSSSLKISKNLHLLERVISLYLPEKNFYLLPTDVIEKLSLHNGVKNSLTLLFEFDENYKLKNYKFLRAKIKLKDRFNYKTFEKILLIEPFKKLLSISRKFQLMRLNNGGYNYVLPLKKFKIEENNLKYELIDLNSKSYFVISELMILYNYIASKLLKKNDFPAIYRNYEEKTSINLNENDPLYYYKIMNVFKSTILSSSPKPHYILGLDVYAQFTSPLRRIYDIINQEHLHRLLDNLQPIYSNEKIEEFIRIAVRVEKRKKFIQRNRLDFWTYVYLKENYKEKIIKGVVCRVNDKWSELFFPEFLITEKVYYKGLDIGRKVNCLIKDVDPFGCKMDIFIVK
jgi:exoribonuclease-2